MNELFGASTPTPWTPTTARYRANVLEWARLLKEKGGHPLLLVSSEPFTGGDAGAWWRELARGRRHRAREVLQRAGGPAAPGPSSAAGGCARRCATPWPSSSRSGSRPSQLGVVMAFQTRRGSGGREGLEPAGAWFEVAKLQALAAKHIAREFRLGYVVSWGWGFFNEQARDPDKLGAGCVWLWARDPSLCAADALPERFDRDLRRRADRPGLGRSLRARRRNDHDERDRCARARDARRRRGADDPLRQARAAAGGVDRSGRRARGGAGDRAAPLRRQPRAVPRRVARAPAAAPPLRSAAIADELRREALLLRLRATAPTRGGDGRVRDDVRLGALRDIPGTGTLPGVDASDAARPAPERARPSRDRARPPHVARAERYAAWAERRRSVR